MAWLVINLGLILIGSSRFYYRIYNAITSSQECVPVASYSSTCCLHAQISHFDILPTCVTHCLVNGFKTGELELGLNGWMGLYRHKCVVVGLKVRLLSAACCGHVGLPCELLKRCYVHAVTVPAVLDYRCSFLYFFLPCNSCCSSRCISPCWPIEGRLGQYFRLYNGHPDNFSTQAHSRDVVFKFM